MASPDPTGARSAADTDPRSVRQPAVAGMFYPSDPDECRAAARAYVRAGKGAGEGPAGGAWTGAIVPHAGWVCSGAIAGEAIGALAAAWGGRNAEGASSTSRPPDVVVVFGAIHTPLPASAAMLSSHAAWREPGADSPVPVELAARLTERPGSGELFAVDDRFHRHEHAVEVEVPLIQAAWPGASLLPVEVPPVDDAERIGRETATLIASQGLAAVYLASSDLTHYGPNYRFAPAGVGPQGLAWAKDNDRRLLDLVAAMRVEQVVPHVREHMNACGGGAIAAMLAACRASGATRAQVLRHANSVETLADVAPQPPTNAVGYAAALVG